jgi:hypothetical protein
LLHNYITQTEPIDGDQLIELELKISIEIFYPNHTPDSCAPALTRLGLPYNVFDVLDVEVVTGKPKRGAEAFKFTRVGYAETSISDDIPSAALLDDPFSYLQQYDAHSTSSSSSSSSSLYSQIFSDWQKMLLEKIDVSLFGTLYGQWGYDLGRDELSKINTNFKWNNFRNRPAFPPTSLEALVIKIDQIEPGHTIGDLHATLKVCGYNNTANQIERHFSSPKLPSKVQTFSLSTPINDPRLSHLFVNCFDQYFTKDTVQALVIHPKLFPSIPPPAVRVALTRISKLRERLIVYEYPTGSHTLQDLVDACRDIGRNSCASLICEKI